MILFTLKDGLMYLGGDLDILSAPIVVTKLGGTTQRAIVFKAIWKTIGESVALNVGNEFTLEKGGL